MDPIESWVDSAELRRLAEALLDPPPVVPEPANDATYGSDFVGYAGTGQPSPQAPAESNPPPLAAPAPAPAPIAPTPTPTPEAPASSPAEQHARSALANARKIAQRGGLLADHATKATPEEETAPQAPPPAQLTQVAPVESAAGGGATVSTPFVARLQAYGTWLREGINARSFFVTDRDGGVLIDEVQSPKLQQVARTLAQASRTANRQAGAAAIGNLHIKIAPDTVLEVVPVTTRYGPLILGILVNQPISPRNVETVARGLQQVIDGNPTS